MRHPRRLLTPCLIPALLCGALAAALLAAGCGANSLQRCYQSKEAYAATLETAADLRDRGVIPQAQVEASKPYRVAARAALDAWEASAKAGDAQGAATNEQKFKDAAAFVQRLIDTFTPARPSTGVPHGNRSGGGVGGGEVDRGTGGDGVAGEPPDHAGRVADGERPDRGGRRAA